MSKTLRSEMRDEAQLYLKAMNESFSQCLSATCPQIQYPQGSQPNIAQRDAVESALLEGCLANFFTNAKELEMYFTGYRSSISSHSAKNLQTEIQVLEAELNDKNELIDKYARLMEQWEAKFVEIENEMKA